MSPNPLVIALAVGLIFVVVALLLWALSGQTQGERNPYNLTPSVQPSGANSVQLTRIVLGPPQRLRLDRLPPGLRLRRGTPVVLAPHHDPLWYEKGWRKQPGKDEYQGNYTAAGRTWKGLVIQAYPGRYQAFIWNPPLGQIERNTGHRLCFGQDGNNGRHRVHFHIEPSSLDHAIASIEVVLHEAITGKPYR